MFKTPARASARQKTGATTDRKKVRTTSSSSALPSPSIGGARRMGGLVQSPQKVLLQTPTCTVQVESPLPLQIESFPGINSSLMKEKCTYQLDFDSGYFVVNHQNCMWAWNPRNV
jgi:hypothetical protein